MDDGTLFDVSTIPEPWHLSYTGYYAGMRLCGSESGKSSHAVYVSDERMLDPNLCRDCKRLWDEAG